MDSLVGVVSESSLCDRKHKLYIMMQLYLIYQYIDFNAHSCFDSSRRQQAYPVLFDGVVVEGSGCWWGGIAYTSLVY